ncbi:hypothetical protein IFM89_032552 [Coptis chinensis]|uniref:Uncharacterized protein n=1 Tax=Coptis chinensis TaxID=261450 RepID=A0A835I596_9MAGN|nr:hypothetical protein IFM89_032552 [Coptis chinensis]
MFVWMINTQIYQFHGDWDLISALANDELERDRNEILMGHHLILMDAVFAKVSFFIGIIPIFVAWVYSEYLEYKKNYPKLSDADVSEDMHCDESASGVQESSNDISSEPDPFLVPTYESEDSADDIEVNEQGERINVVNEPVNVPSPVNVRLLDENMPLTTTLPASRGGCIASGRPQVEPEIRNGTIGYAGNSSSPVDNIITSVHAEYDMQDMREGLLSKSLSLSWKRTQRKLSCFSLSVCLFLLRAALEMVVREGNSLSFNVVPLLGLLTVAEESRFIMRKGFAQAVSIAIGSLCSLPFFVAPLSQPTAEKRWSIMYLKSIGLRFDMLTLASLDAKASLVDTSGKVNYKTQNSWVVLRGRVPGPKLITQGVLDAVSRDIGTPLRLLHVIQGCRHSSLLGHSHVCLLQHRGTPYFYGHGRRTGERRRKCSGEKRFETIEQAAPISVDEATGSIGCHPQSPPPVVTTVEITRDCGMDELLQPDYNVTMEYQKYQRKYPQKKKTSKETNALPTKLGATLPLVSTRCLILGIREPIPDLRKQSIKAKDVKEQAPIRLTRSKRQLLQE